MSGLAGSGGCVMVSAISPLSNFPLPRAGRSGGGVASAQPQQEVPRAHAFGGLQRAEGNSPTLTSRKGGGSDSERGRSPCQPRITTNLLLAGGCPGGDRG